MIAIVDSGGANIASVVFAFERLGAEARLTADPDALASAERVVLPGVGAAAEAMARLHRTGLVDTLRGLTQPVLGLCLGMQLMFEHSEEGDTPLLGLLPGRVVRFAAGAGRRVPHMGWNRLRVEADHPLTKGLPAPAYAYFVHGYHAPAVDAAGARPDGLIASCDHGGAFAAMVARGNFMGAQFHPERSAVVGARILANFLRLDAPAPVAPAVPAGSRMQVTP